MEVGKQCGCVFCKNAQELVAHNLSCAPGLGASRSVYLAGDRFMSSIDTHPVVPGPYFLVTPVNHYSTFSDIHGREFERELSIHLGYLDSCVRSDPSLPQRVRIVSEHGEDVVRKAAEAAARGEEYRPGYKSIPHAHIHVCYANADPEMLAEKVVTELMLANFEFSVIPTGDNYLNLLHKNTRDDADYLYIRIGNWQVMAHDYGQAKPASQFFRQILAKELIGNFVNWKTMTPEQHEEFNQRLYQFQPKNLFYKGRTPTLADLNRSCKAKQAGVRVRQRKPINAEAAMPQVIGEIPM